MNTAGGKPHTLENIRYMLANWIRWDKKGTIIAFARIPVAIVLPIVTAWLNRTVVDLVVNHASATQFIYAVSAIFLLLEALNWLSHGLDEKMESFQQIISIHYALETFEKLLTMDYELLESYEGRQKFERCRSFALHGSQSDGAWAAVRLTGLIKSLLGIATYLAILTLVHPVLLGVVLLTCLLEFRASQKSIRIAAKTRPYCQFAAHLCGM